jgi:hypothetical protein
MKLKILDVDSLCKYDIHPYDHHICQDEDGEEYRIDLMVDGGFSDDFDPKSLIGKTVEISDMHTYLYIAHNVRVIDE